MRLLAAASSLRQKSRSRFISAISAGDLDCMLLKTKYSFGLIMFTTLPFLLISGETLGLLPALPGMEAVLLWRASGAAAGAGAVTGAGFGAGGERNDEAERSADTGRLKGRAVGLKERGEEAGDGARACWPANPPAAVELVLSLRVRAGEGERLVGERGR